MCVRVEGTTRDGYQLSLRDLFIFGEYSRRFYVLSSPRNVLMVSHRHRTREILFVLSHRERTMRVISVDGFISHIIIISARFDYTILYKYACYDPRSFCYYFCPAVRRIYYSKCTYTQFRIRYVYLPSSCRARPSTIRPKLFLATVIYY